MNRFIGALILLVVFCPATDAQPLAPGDLVRLKERDLHIPAHPAPSDSRVHLRFTSGTQATVLSLDAASSWIEVRGEAVSGGQQTGWITPQYIASREGENPPGGGALSWCPAKGVSTPHPSGRLRLATWNLANLHAQDGQAIYTGADPSEKRAAVDYERIRCYVRLFDPDILAVQEVDGEAALSRVVDTDVYDVHVDMIGPGAASTVSRTPALPSKRASV